MMTIPLGGKYGKGKYALVDDEDYDKISQFNWTAIKRANNVYYACRSINFNGKRTIILLHRDIMNVSDSKVCVDHINHDGLNNCKSNLRICTMSENLGNRRNNTSGTLKLTSQYKGVHWYARKNKWHAQIMVNYKHIHLGYFDIEINAAKAYDIAAVKYFGEFAKINFLDS